MKRIIILTLSLILGIVYTINANSQLSDVTQVLNGGIGDANKLAKAYLNPWGKDFAVSLGNGWFNTAKPHGFLPIPGFDITFMGTVTMVPSSEQTFDLKSLGLSSLQATNNANTITPTIAGKNVSGQSVSFQPVTVNGQKFTPPGSFNLPGGTGVSMVALPIVQAGIGLPFKTEIDARFFPTINISKYGSLGLWGVGLKHDIKQWIPVISHIPFWDMSLQAAYTSFSLSSATSTFLTPDPSMYYIPANYDLTQYNIQAVKFNSHAFVANLLVSSDIPIINIYGGLGFSIASSDLKVTGKFPIPQLPTTTEISSRGGDYRSDINNISNPINANFNGNGLRATIGLRLRLAFFAIHGDMTYASGGTYYTGGLGISFR
jgi:hypothetical protein